MFFMPDPIPPDVDAAFADFAPNVREQLKLCRMHILATASEVEHVGPVTETLKWGQPSYLTEKSKSGSTIRLAPASQGSGSERPALFVHCATDLIEQFKTFYPECFDYQGKRALIIRSDVQSVTAELRHCIALALTYKLRRQSTRK